MTQRLLNLLNGSVVFRNVVGAFIGFLFMTGTYLLVTTTIDVISDQVVEATPRNAYFDYKEVEFVEREADSLIFASTSVFNQQYPVYWNDVLRCQNGKEYSFYSVQNTSSDQPNTRQDYRTIKWNYNEPFPEGKTCTLESTITMDVNGHSKRQKINSEAFLIPKE